MTRPNILFSGLEISNNHGNQQMSLKGTALMWLKSFAVGVSDFHKKALDGLFLLRFAVYNVHLNSLNKCQSFLARQAEYWCLTILWRQYKISRCAVIAALYWKEEI